MKPIAKNFLPNFLRRKAVEWERRNSQDPAEDLRIWKTLCSTLADYPILDFPFFSKVDAWRAYGEASDYELWVLERMGWAEWRGAPKLLYSMEGISIPSVEESEIITISSITPPYLAAATELLWDAEIEAGSVQVAAVEDLPEAIRFKLSMHMPKFLRELAETLDQMESHQLEFSDYIDARVEDYVTKLDASQKEKLSAIDRYFRQERRLELFHDFLEQIQRR